MPVAPKQLRQYQSNAIGRVLAAITRRPILVMPTGAGKTFTAASLIHRLQCHTLWLAHRKELIEQAYHTLSGHDLFCGIIKSGINPTYSAPIQVASVSTLAKREHMPRAECIVIDECHHAAADSYSTILARYPNAPIVGLTATPFRLDGRGLGDIFGEIVVAATTRQLCDDGTLHRPKVWAGKAPDLRGVKLTGGDYNLKQAATRSNTGELTGDIVETWKKHAMGKRTVCFAVNVEHSQAIVQAFRDAGIPAEHVDGKSKDRGPVLARLASGVTQIVSNCMVLTEGWDLPSLECAIIARPTASLNLHLQMIGRIMRAADGKTGCVCLDHAGNHHVHGLVTRDIDYSLDARKAGESEPLGLRRCRKCGLFFEPDVFRCPECGWTPSVADLPRDTPGVRGEGELEEFVDEFDYRKRVWQELEAQREASGFKPGWSAFRFEEQFGVKPVVVGGELADARDDSKENKARVYAALVAEAQAKRFASGWAAHKYREVFGVWPRGLGVDDGRGDMVRHKYMRMAGVA